MSRLTNDENNCPDLVSVWKHVDKSIKTYHEWSLWWRILITKMLWKATWQVFIYCVWNCLHCVFLCGADAPWWWSPVEPQHVLSVPHAFLLPSSHLPDSGPGIHNLCAATFQPGGQQQQQQLLWDHGSLWVITHTHPHTHTLLRPHKVLLGLHQQCGWIHTLVTVDDRKYERKLIPILLS